MIPFPLRIATSSDVKDSALLGLFPLPIDVINPRCKHFMWQQHAYFFLKMQIFQLIFEAAKNFVLLNFENCCSK
jgi:hypothetical protein